MVATISLFLRQYGRAKRCGNISWSINGGSGHRTTGMVGAGVAWQVAWSTGNPRKNVVMN
jgi:hypothetical protein